MKRFLVCALFTPLLTVSCLITAPAPNKNPQSQVAAPSDAQLQSSLPAPDILTKKAESTPITKVEPVNTPPSTTPTTEPINNKAQIVGIGMDAQCGDAFIAQVSNPPEITKDLFEHHAQGTFLIVTLAMQNLTDRPIQIWDGDYFLEGIVDGTTQEFTPHKAATGYLFITRGNDLNQDQIKPGTSWKTYLAFDVPTASTNWILVVKPGYEINRQICEARISIIP